METMSAIEAEDPNRKGPRDTIVKGNNRHGAHNSRDAQSASLAMEKSYQRYAWLLPTIVGIPGVVIGILYAFGTVLNPSLLQAQLGQSWSSFSAADPRAAGIYVTALREWGVTLATLGIVTVALAAGPFRKGVKWGWMFTFGQPFFLLYLTTESAVDGDPIWLVSAALLVVSVLGLALPYRKFFPNKRGEDT